MLTKDSLPQLGLREGIMVNTSMVHNGGWYNSKGEKIGWGDLGPNHFQKIQAELKPGELFIVLGERDSFWNFVTYIGVTGSLSKVSSKEKNPGVNYLVEKARWCITKDVVYHLDDYRNVDDVLHGISYFGLARKTLAKMIGEAV